MKVLHIMNELRPSGAEVMLESAGPIWKQHGCELHVAAISPEPGPFADRLRAAGWQVSAIDPAGGTWKLMRKVTDAVRAISPDVVHLHQEGKSLPLCRAVHRTGLPIFRTVHNNFPFTGLLRIQKTVERWLCRRMGSRHIAISPSVRLNEMKRFLNPTELCWNWFNVRSFFPPTSEERSAARTRLGIEPSWKLLVSVGNGSDIKNYRLIIEAMSLIADPTLHYAQVGNPHPGGVDALLAESLGLRDHVHLKGAKDCVHEWLWAADVFVMPSVFEGYGLAAVEALAAGCECVFAECPGLTDFRELGVRAEWAGLVAAEFSEALKRSLDTRNASGKTDENSRIVREYFDVRQRAISYHALWEDACSKCT
jgi:glycosyltransferase involved in cell wall biosynthesis